MVDQDAFGLKHVSCFWEGHCDNIWLDLALVPRHPTWQFTVYSGIIEHLNVQNVEWYPGSKVKGWVPQYLYRDKVKVNFLWPHIACHCSPVIKRNRPKQQHMTTPPQARETKASSLVKPPSSNKMEYIYSIYILK
jgi:hypothetical protein